MVFRLLLGVVLLSLSACGVQSQQTPEPHETERISRLAEQLGTQQTFDSRTRMTNPAPDGRILLSWINRRRDTLNGSLRPTLRPATTNPGSIRATLAWEREALRADAAAVEACMNRTMDEAANDVELVVNDFSPSRC
jgi:hypothetical protein